MMLPRFTPWKLRILLGLLAAGVAVFWLLIISPHGENLLDENVRDLMLRRAALSTPDSRITVVDINEASLAALGPWPWPRERLATMIEALLGTYSAQTVGMDMVFPERADTAGDALLASLAQHAPLTMAVAFDFVARHPPLGQGTPGKATYCGTPNKGIPATGFIGNHASLGLNASTGNIGFIPDRDGAIRRLPWTTIFAGCIYHPLAASMLASRPGLENMESLMTSVDDIPFWRLRYRYSWNAYTIVPAAEVLDGSTPAELISGRHILIGSSALGLADRVATPLDPSTPGVLVHAAMLSELLDRGSSATPSLWSGRVFVLTWLAVSVSILVFILPRWSPAIVLMWICALASGWLVVAYMTIIAGNQISFVPPWLAYLVLLVFALPYEWWLSKQESRRMQRMLSHYVAPTVLEALLRQPGETPLEPRYCEVSVLIADMEGYTPLTSLLSLQDAAQLTRDFLDALTRPVLATEGTLDKYTGDGLVAFWGAPIYCPDQADRAIDAALGILSAVSLLNHKRACAGMPTVRVRIGIESGAALVGDLGTPFRSTYTAVGDCINFASRLQNAARNMNTNILIGPKACQSVKRHELRPIGKIALRGTQQVIPVHTVGNPPP